MEILIDKKSSKELKGIAVIFVILSHFASYLNVSGLFKVLFPLGGIGVALFLFLSGYGLTKSTLDNGIEKYWGKEFWRYGQAISS